MRLLDCSRITVDELTALARVDDLGVTDEPWAALARGELSDNAQGDPRDARPVHGCCTVGDCWTFVRMDARDLDTDRPSLTVCSSPEYGTRSEAATVVRTLQSIVREAAPPPG